MSAPIDPEKEILELKGRIRLFETLQFILPVLMLLMAALLPRFPVGLDAATAQVVVYILCAFALLDFVMLRFFVLNVLRKRLADVENGGGASL